MEVLAIRPAPPGSGNAIARLDLQLDCGVRLFNLKVAETPAGLRVFGPSAFGSAAATFTPATGAEIARLAAEALGDIDRHETSRAA